MAESQTTTKEEKTMNTVKELPNGQFDVLDGQGNSLSHKFGGTFYKRDVASEAARMVDAFDRVEARIGHINQELQEAQNEH